MKLNRLFSLSPWPASPAFPVFGQTPPADVFRAQRKDSPSRRRLLQFRDRTFYEQQYEQTSQNGRRHQSDRGLQEGLRDRPEVSHHRRAPGGNVLEGAARARRMVDEANEILKHDPNDLADAPVAGAHLLAQPGRHQRLRRANGNGRARPSRNMRRCTAWIPRTRNRLYGWRASTACITSRTKPRKCCAAC